MTLPLTIFLPTLNEAEGLKVVLPRILAQNPAQVIVSDGNSKDETCKVAASMGAEVYVQKERGIRHAYIEAWPMITQPHVITMSPDGNCIPEDIPRLFAKMQEGYDMVVASRYGKDAGSEDDDLVTGFGNWLFTSTVNILFSADYSDAMGIYRGYRTKLFYELGLDRHEAYTLVEKMYCTRIGIEPLLSARAAALGCKVGKIGSPEPKRIAGERKLQVLRWGAAYYTQFYLEFFRLRVLRQKPPLTESAIQSSRPA